MKMIDSFMDGPQTQSESQENIQKPCLADLYELSNHHSLVHYLHSRGIACRLSFEETLILIIQGLVKENNIYIKKEMDRITQLKPDPESIKEINELNKRPWYRR